MGGGGPARHQRGNRRRGSTEAVGMGSHRGGDGGGDGGRAPDASHGATGQLHGRGVVKYNHSVAMIGDSHAWRLAAVERPTVKVYGCLQIGTRATSDGARGGLGSELEADACFLRQATITAVAHTRPDCLVISFGGNALLERQKDGSQVLRHLDLPETKEACATAISHCLTIVAHCPWMAVVVMGVVPRLRMTEEALAEIRALSQMLADVSHKHGVAFIDVEALLSEGEASASRPVVGTRHYHQQVTVDPKRPPLSPDAYEDDLVHLSADSLHAIWRAIDEIIFDCGREVAV